MGSGSPPGSVARGSRFQSDWTYPGRSHHMQATAILAEKKELLGLGPPVLEWSRSSSRRHALAPVHCPQRKSTGRAPYHPEFLTAPREEKRHSARGAVYLPGPQAQEASKDCLSGCVSPDQRCYRRVYPGQVPLFVSRFHLPVSINRVEVQALLLLRRRTSRGERLLTNCDVSVLP